MSGTQLADTLTGGAGVDVLTGLGGADVINGGGGDDVLYGHSPGSVGTINSTLVVSGMITTVAAATAPSDPGFLYVVEKDTGIIWRANVETGQRTVFLDIPQGEFTTNDERGVLGLAFHPNYEANGRFFVFLADAQGDIQVREYHRSASNPAVADAASTLAIEVPHPTFSNHYGSFIGFSPVDGYLYISTGDGGGGGDTGNNAQNLNVLLGKMLRIDVNGDDFPGDASRNYAIPASNPFVGVAGADEIWAYGLRNPFRASFDPRNGDLYIGDVGQAAREEINYRAFNAAPGANFGWRIIEGSLPYNPGPPGTPQPGDPSLILPVLEYDPSVGRTVIGGEVFVGAAPGFVGHYVFGDYVSGRIFSLAVVNGQAVDAVDRSAQITGSMPTFIVDFVTSSSGALYVLGIGGNVWRLDPSVGAEDVGDILNGEGGNDTIYGNVGADQLSGGDGNDTLHADSFDVLVSGGAGIDWVYFNDTRAVTFNAGAAAVEVVFGGSGDDTIDATTQTLVFTAFGGNGADNLTGGISGDTLFGQAGNDTLAGGDGADVLWGEADADQLTGGAGDDTLFVDAQDTLISGGANYDYVYFTGAGNFVIDAGTAGLEWIFSGGGNDTILAASQTVGIIVYGGAGGDTITGGAGADVIFGQDGADTIVGGALNDTLWGEAGADSLSGGDGDDTLIADATDTFVSGGVGYDYAYVTGTGDFSVNAGTNGIEWIVSSSGNDIINAATQNVGIVVYGGGGGDTITGGTGADVIFGQDGNDILTGGTQNDTLWGEAGADQLTGGEGDDTLIADALDTLTSGGNGYDYVYVTGTGNFSINAGANGVDWIDSGAGNDTLNGAAHTTAFTAYGGDGADTITGGSGNDVLFGEDGADIITGGGGGDVFIGGAGADNFVFAAGWGSDLVADFQNGSDRFDMTALAGSGVTSIGDLTITAQGADALISWNGNSILVQNAAGQIDSSDFIFGP